MRLTERQQKMIRETTLKVFGDTAKVWLFGSRVDDTKKGGDIDLLIEITLTDISTIVRAEIVFLSQLEAKLGEQKIDVLIDYPTRTSYPPIFSVAQQTGILL